MLTYNWLESTISSGIESTVFSVSVENLLAERNLLTAHETCNLQRIIFQAGMYKRKSPFLVDMTEVSADIRHQLELYYNQKVQHYKSICHLVFSKGLLIGQGTVITRDNRLVTDSAAEFIAQGIAPDGLRLTIDRRYTATAKVRRFVERPSLVLKRPWYRNYGHWLVDNASILAILQEIELPIDIQIVIGKNWSPKMKSIVAETLNQVAPFSKVVEHDDGEIWECASLHYVTPLHVPPLFKHPYALMRLKELVLKGRPAGKSSDRGIYVRRAEGSSRSLVNEAEIMKICLDNNIGIVSPETMGLREQAHIFQSSRFIIGVKGAALTNTMFCKRGTHVLVLSPSDFPDPFFYDIVNHAEGHYSEIFGSIVSRASSQGQNPFKIDAAKFQLALVACGMAKGSIRHGQCETPIQRAPVTTNASVGWKLRIAAE